jgi:hypothetical protein
MHRLLNERFAPIRMVGLRMLTAPTPEVAAGWLKDELLQIAVGRLLVK